MVRYNFKLGYFYLLPREDALDIPTGGQRGPNRQPSLPRLKFMDVSRRLLEETEEGESGGTVS